MSTVYLLHLDKPLRHARHYVGLADDLAARLERHAGKARECWPSASSAGLPGGLSERGKAAGSLSANSRTGRTPRSSA